MENEKQLIQHHSSVYFFAKQRNAVAMHLQLMNISKLGEYLQL